MQQIKDILNAIPEYSLRVCIDIGANKGSVARYLAALPSRPKVYAFEPFPSTFEALRQNLDQFDNIELLNVAVSDRAGSASMQVHPSCLMNRLSDTKGSVPVETVNLAEFVVQRELDHIDYLKVDTEGHDLRVLMGAIPILRQVDFFECEASMNAYNQYHNSFLDIWNLMRIAGFGLFKFYDQTLEWGGGGQPILRRSNPVFVNLKLVDVTRNVLRS